VQYGARSARNAEAGTSAGNVATSWCYSRMLPLCANTGLASGETIGTARSAERLSNVRLERISLTEIVPPAHPVRANIDDAALDDLALDIKRTGVRVPLLVKPADGRYEVIYGHRRLLAANKAQVAAVPCLVWEPADGDPVLFKLHENLHRENLNPVEEAVFYAELFEQLGHDVDRVCEATGQNRAYIDGRLSLLSGDADVMEALGRGAISLGVAHQLNRLKRQDHRAYLLEWAIRQGATVGTVSAWVAEYNYRADFESALPPTVTAAQAFEPVRVEPPKCFLCGSDEDPWEFEFHHIHRSCRRRMEAEVRRREQGTGNRE
jgi:ParB/RepB/Spo0J family partition protein